MKNARPPGMAAATFLVLAIPLIAIGLVALRLSSLRQLDEFQPGQPGLVTGGAVKED